MELKSDSVSSAGRKPLGSTRSPFTYCRVVLGVCISSTFAVGSPECSCVQPDVRRGLSYYPFARRGPCKPPEEECFTKCWHVVLAMCHQVPAAMCTKCRQPCVTKCRQKRALAGAVVTEQVPINTKFFHSPDLMWSSRTRQGCIRRPSGAPSSVNVASAAVLGGVTVLSNSAHLSSIEVHISEAGPSEQSRFSGNGFLCVLK